jgi:hypothetical protein
MYFSITYGPDQAGRVSMNFGPLNKDGGERRLNVAVTRAKHALKVFTCLLPDRMDLSRTRAKGVADLKLFLEYARRGIKALAEEAATPRGDFDSPFEEIVAEALSRRGWTAHPQVGVSTFRVDLGVVDPDRPADIWPGWNVTEQPTTAPPPRGIEIDSANRSCAIWAGRSCAPVHRLWHDAETAANKLDASLRKILECTREETARIERERCAKWRKKSPRKSRPRGSNSRPHSATGGGAPP